MGHALKALRAAVRARPQPEHGEIDDGQHQFLYDRGMMTFIDAQGAS
jgi:hypothetical protein